MPLLLASQHVEDGTKWTSFCRWHFQTHALDGKVFHSNITVFPDGSIDIMSSVVQVLVLLIFFNSTIRVKSWMLINYQISIHIAKPYISIGFRLPFHWYIYTNIKMLPLKLHQASTWRIQGCVLSIVHSWENVSFALWRHNKEILSALLALHVPSRRTNDVEHWCSLLCQSEQTFEQIVYEPVIWYILKLIWRRCDDL